MKTLNTFRILCSFSIILVFFSPSYAGNYTWTGTTSSTWTTTTNWSPNGNPSTNDTVTITTGTNNCKLAANTTIKRLIVSTDTIDFNRLTLTVSSDVAISGGFCTNGTLVSQSSSTVNFSGGTIDVTVNVTGVTIRFNGAIFKQPVTAIYKGSTICTGTGGNKFNSTLALTDSGTGAWAFANSTADTCYDIVTVKNTTSGTIYLAHNSTNNYFSKKVTLTNNSSGTIYCAYYNSAIFHDSLLLDCIGSGAVRFGYGGGSATLSSYLGLGSSGLSSSGTIDFQGVLQTASGNFSLTGSGTSAISFGPGSVFSASITASAPALSLDGSTFNKKATLTHTGNLTTSCKGGCTFNDSAWIYHSNSSGGSLNLATVNSDAYTKPVTIENSNKGKVVITQGVFSDKTIFRNNSPSSSTGTPTAVSASSYYTFIVADGNTCTFNNSLTLYSDSGGITFGTSSHSAIVFSDYSSLIVDSNYLGHLCLSKVTYSSTSALQIPFSSNYGFLILDTNNIFNAPVNCSVKHVQLNGSTFNDTLILKTTCLDSDTSKGGNTFNGLTVIIDSNTVAAKSMILAGTYPDDFNGNVIFKQYGTGRMYPCHTKNSTFSADISTDGDNSITFGNGGGRVVIDGDSDNVFDKLGTYQASIKKLELKKTGGTFTLYTPMTVSDSVIFTKGFMAADSVRSLIIPDNGIVSGASDSSFVIGLVKKIGNDAFTFPLGNKDTSDGYYHPLSISAPSSSTDAFTAEYIFGSHGLSTDADSTIENESLCEYWNVERMAGTSKVKIGLGWNSNSCNVFGLDSMHVAVWDTTSLMWKDKGNASTTGNLSMGTVVSHDTINKFGKIILADKACSTFNPVTTSQNIKCKDDTSGIGLVVVTGGTLPYTFAWSYGSIVNDSATNLPPGTYTVIISDVHSCHDTDSISISQPTTLFTVDSIHFSPETCYGTSLDGTSKVFLSGGDTPYSYLWNSDSLLNTDSISDLISDSYVALVMDSNGCARSDTAYVGFKSKIDIAFVSSIVNTSSNDDGKVTAIISDAEFPVDYSWDTDPEQTEATATNLPVGLYHLTVTDNNGCEVTDSVFVDSLHTIGPGGGGGGGTPPCAVEIDIEGPFSQCGLEEIWDLNHSASFTYNTFPTLSLNWSSSGNILLSSTTGSSVTATFYSVPATGDYIRVADGGCTSYIYIQECCNPDPPVIPSIAVNDFNRDHYTQANALAALGCVSHGCGFINSIPRTYYINGEFNLGNLGIAFSNCTFIFGPGAVMFTTVGYCSCDSLTFNNCNFLSGCDAMWRGLRVPFHSYLGMTDCHIYDAQYAIKESATEMLVNFTNNYFERNYVSMYAPPKFAGNYLTPPGTPCVWSTLSGNTFNGNASLRSPFSGQSPLPMGNKTFAGIFVNDFDALSHVNNPNNYAFYWDFANPNPNTFENLNIGIYGLESDIDVYNCHFENIRPVSAYTASFFFNGSAIYSESNNLVQNLNCLVGAQNGIGSTFGNTFNRCWRDVYCRGPQNSNIQNNVSQLSASKSIIVQAAFGNTCNISQNTITTCNLGIECSANTATATVISENIITTGHYHLDIGIWLSDPLWLSGGTFILDNDITTFGTYGIHVLNNNFAMVRANTVRLRIPYLLGLMVPFYGIRNDNCYGDVISCNTVDGVSWGLSYNRSAIVSSFSTIGQVSCNTTDNTQRGFQFLGSCDPSLFYGNQLKNHYDGLVLGKSGISSGEFGPQTHVGNNKLPGNEYLGGNGFGTFAHDATLSINSNQLSQQFFIKSSTIYEPIGNDLVGACCVLFPTDPMDGTDPFDCYEIPPYCPIPQPFPAASFVVDTTEAPTTKREVMKKEHEKNMATFLLLNSSYLDSSDVLEQFSDSISETNQGEFAQVNYTILSSDTDSLGYILDSLKTHITFAKGMNEAIDPVNTYEEILRKVNSIKFNSIGDERFHLTQDEAEDLLEIAYLCPYIYGPAVYDARGLLRLINPSFNVEDESVCEPDSEMRLANPHVNEQPTNSISLFPNPTSNEINFEISNLNDERILYEIYNFAGQSIAKGKVPNHEGIFKINVSSLTPGIYYLRLFGGSTILSSKFSVLK